jgi:mono/diheme cytochrome c family protein
MNAKVIRWMIWSTAMASLTACSAPPAENAQAAPLSGGRVYGDAQRGKDYVERLCTTCHAMGVTGTDGAPPLALLKKDFGKTDSYIRRFLFAPHKPMPPVVLTNQEVEDIIAYLLGPA